MPNWCFTQYAIIGKKEEVGELYETMKKLQDMPEPLAENAFGKNWLGRLVIELGAKVDGEGGVYCRGMWDGLSLSPNGEILTFTTETAWSRMDEVENLIRTKFPSLAIYFLEEELGNGLLRTNDQEKRFFPCQVVIDEESEDMDYYTVEGALEHLSSFFGKKIESLEEAKPLLDAVNQQQDECGGEGHILVHVADIV